MSFDPSTPAFIERGRDGKSPVVFVHGLAGDKRVWSDQSAHLERERRVVALDLRGHGDTPMRRDHDYSIPALAEDVIAVADRLELQRFVVCGHSLGAFVATAVADGWPDRVCGLLLVDPAGDRTRLPRSRVAAVQRRLEGEGYREYVEQWFKGLLSGADERVERAVLSSLRATPPEVVVRVSRALASYDPVPALERCTCPKLAIVNAELNDGPTSLHRLASGLPHRVMTGVSHWLMMDRPGRFNGLMDAFLTSVAQR